jgi:hypothetical protein
MGGDPHLSGEARVSQRNEISASVRGAQERGGGTSTRPESHNPEAVISGGQIEAIALTGRPDQFKTTSAFAVTDHNSSANVRGTAGGAAGYSGRGTTVDSSGRTRNFDVHTPSGSTPVSPSQFVEVFRMKLEVRECGFMKGTIDTAKLQGMRQAGFGVSVQQAEWSAELQERDKAYEAEVNGFASQAIPATLTWEYVNQFNARLEALRAAKNSDYGRCVLRKVQSKATQLELQALRTLTASYPDRCQGATDAVITVANQRLLELMRHLAIGGFENCPDFSKAQNLVSGPQKRCP